MLTRAIGITILVATASASAAKLDCYEEPSTRRHVCYNPAETRANGAVRSSPVYMGGPSGAKPVGANLIVNCDSLVAVLQDSKTGVNIGGGKQGQTRALDALSRWMCSLPKPAQNKNIRQFGK